TAVPAPEPGGPEVLRVGQVPMPEPAAGEVLIRVAAAGVNAPDLAQRRGDYPPPDGHSPILGLEVSGTVVAGAGHWRVGAGVVSSDEKSAYALGLGARAVIRRDREDVVERARALTGGRGADRVLDIVGGEATRQNIDAVARGGHIVLAATLGGREATLPLNKI